MYFPDEGTVYHGDNAKGRYCHNKHVLSKSAPTVYIYGLKKPKESNGQILK